MKRTIPPYKGDAPYIFISYSHRDAAQVFPILSSMHAEGYRIWFDEGIDPGTEWDENIAQHVINCSYFIAFISANYLGSANCKDELNYARDQDKKILLIYLEQVQLSSGMAMRLNRLQYISKYAYANESDFFAKLHEADGIEQMKENKNMHSEEVTAVAEAHSIVPSEQKPSQPTTATASLAEPPIPCQAEPTLNIVSKKCRVAKTFAWILFSFAACWSIFPLAGIIACIDTGFTTTDIEMLVFFSGITLTTIVGAQMLRKAFKQATKYAPLIQSAGTHSVDEIAAKTGDSSQETKKEISTLIVHRYLRGIYIDHQTDEIVVSDTSLPEKLRKRHIWSVVLHVLAVMYGWMDGFIMLVLSPEDPSMLIGAVVCFTIGFTLSYTAVNTQRNSVRETVLYTLIHEKNHRSIPVIAAKTSVTAEQVKKRIQSMISHNLLKSAYIDEQTQQIVFNE